MDHMQYRQLATVPTGRPKGSTNRNKRKMNKDPNRPKRPTSAYFYFVASKRLEKEKMGEKITRVAEWTKEVSAVWRALTPAEKKPFEKQAAKDKERYDTQMAIYKGKDLNKPKRPQSSYFLWLADFRIRMKGENIENKELLRQAGEEWKSLTLSEKKPYEIKAEEEKRKYELAMKEYNSGALSAKKPRMDAAGDAKNGREEEDDDDDDEDDDDEYEDDDDE